MISIQNLVKTYSIDGADEVKALRGVNLEIAQGEMVAIMGVSGSGKSTLLHIIGCLDRATSGEYIFDGETITRRFLDSLSQVRNEKIGFVLQDYGLLEDKTAFENVMFPLAFNKAVSFKMMKSLALKALVRTNVSELKNKRVNKLSGGQKQRVAIARAIVTNPKLILADEPTAALDHKTADEIMALFKALKIQGKTIVIVTHDKRIAEMCGRIVYISEGVITNEE